MTKLIEPVMMLTIGSMVAFVAISLLQPLFQASQVMAHYVAGPQLGLRSYRPRPHEQRVGMANYRLDLSVVATDPTGDVGSGAHGWEYPEQASGLSRLIPAGTVLKACSGSSPFSL